MSDDHEEQQTDLEREERRLERLRLRLALVPPPDPWGDDESDPPEAA
jgi:hypothetical protein